MDCDHMVKPEIFLKMGACMLDSRVGVCLVPQARRRRCNANLRVTLS
jgi:hypothetical protein